MRKKTIKTFSVDVDVYDALVAMFRESGAEVSVSYYVAKCLKELLRYLETMKGQKETSDEFTVPLSFIIERAVRSPIVSTADEIPYPGMSMADLESEISGWQWEYDAHTRKIPGQFWGFIKSGKFKLSPDKRFVTNIESGRKYTLDEHRDIIEIVDKAGPEGVGKE
jgi:hypothetical protein